MLRYMQSQIPVNRFNLSIDLVNLSSIFSVQKQLAEQKVFWETTTQDRLGYFSTFVFIKDILDTLH
jgi:hypothetical protein